MLFQISHHSVLIKNKITNRKKNPHLFTYNCVSCFHKIFYKKVFIIFLITALFNRLNAQPYIDVARVNYTRNPVDGINDKKNPLRSDIFNANITLPIELKKGGDVILLNPYFDQNNGTIAGRDYNVVNHGLNAGFLKKVGKDWSVLSAIMLRRNKEAGKKISNIEQYGGTVVIGWQKTSTLNLKLGIYFNKEYFRSIFIPLAGIDWQIDSRNKLFGIMPSNLTFEQTLNKRFAWGANFRATTNTYLLSTPDPCATGDCSRKNYLRINDNQLGLFLDTYISPRLVFVTESGYTILRKYRFGTHSDVVHSFTDYKNDNFYLRASLAFRVNLRNR